MANLKFVLYRILGNDLPPRHRKGQTLANLKLVLKREPAFKGVEKRWIINRIVDPLEEGKIIGFLEQNGQKYQRIRFDIKKYNHIPREHFNERLDEMIGLNAARNLALREGKASARWVLVFDGNCYFTSSAWQEIVRVCSEIGDFKYIVVPMLRILRGGKGGSCEPQIIFRNDSREEFDTNFRYGQNSKVELLCRLGVPGIWDCWDGDKKVPVRSRRVKEFGSFITAGHVWRLPSGNEGAERYISRREAHRKRGIELLMNKIDSMSV